LHYYSEIIASCDHVRLLGVTLSSDLRLHRHVSTVIASCHASASEFRRSLDANLKPHSFMHASIAVTLSWRVRRKRRQTSCNECWTLRLGWSAAQKVRPRLVAASSH